MQFDLLRVCIIYTFVGGCVTKCLVMYMLLANHDVLLLVILHSWVLFGFVVFVGFFFPCTLHDLHKHPINLLHVQTVKAQTLLPLLYPKVYR